MPLALWADSGPPAHKPRSHLPGVRYTTDEPPARTLYDLAQQCEREYKRVGAGASLAPATTIRLLTKSMSEAAPIHPRTLCTLHGGELRDLRTSENHLSESESEAYHLARANAKDRSADPASNPTDTSQPSIRASHNVSASASVCERVLVLTSASHDV